MMSSRARIVSDLRRAIFLAVTSQGALGLLFLGTFLLVLHPMRPSRSVCRRVLQSLIVSFNFEARLAPNWRLNSFSSGVMPSSRSSMKRFGQWI